MDNEKKQVDEKLSAAEALYGFISWLVSRDEVTTLSGHHSPFIGADLVDEFCKANDLPDPREGWEKNLKRPNDEPWVMPFFDDLFDDDKLIALSGAGFGPRMVTLDDTKKQGQK